MIDELPDIDEKEQMKSYRKAGVLTAEALERGKGLVKEGMLLKDVLDRVEEFISSKGGMPAFPAQCSLNEVAAHFCPGPEDNTAFKQGDIAKLDIGVAVNGFIADSAVTVIVGGDSSYPEKAALAKSARDALNTALKLVRPGTKVNEIGRAIQETIEGQGFHPVTNLSGHGLGRFEVHESPSIPNFASSDDTELEEGMAIAIEPFATTGNGRVGQEGNSEIFNQAVKKQVRGQFAREVLREIQPLNGLPFSMRGISAKLGINKARFGINELIRAGVLQEHPPLVEKSRGLVAQAEHSVIVRDNPIILTKFL